MRRNVPAGGDPCPAKIRLATAYIVDAGQSAALKEEVSFPTHSEHLLELFPQQRELPIGLPYGFKIHLVNRVNQ